MQSFPRDVLLDTLLDALAAERHVRAPLLLTILDELGAGEKDAAAVTAAQGLLQALRAAPLGEHEFARRVGELRALLRSARTRPLVTARPAQRWRRSASGSPAA